MRASFDALDEAWPTWFATGRRLAYAVTTGTALGDRMVARDVGGTSQPADLGDAIGGNFSRDGKYFAFYVDDRGRNRIRYAAVDAQGNVGSPTPLFKSADEPDALGPTFSPDGQLMAYVERQPSGNMEIFVTRFPSGEGRLQVSSGGGRAAVWAANGELFYLDGSTNGVKHMTAVRITGTDTLRASVPETLFEIGEEFYASFPRPHFDVTPDGKQLLMLRRSAHAGPAMRWVLVQNWRSEFTQLRR
jgi:Tol biopolymer transport system component